MNPYDFVRIAWNRSPERREPIWHNRFIAQDQHPLYTGSIEVDIYAETPIFVPERASERAFDPRQPMQFMKNGRGEYIISGSSLKGMLRTIGEALGNGCLTLFSGEYEQHRVHYDRKVPDAFRHCQRNDRLCITCRTFGMLSGRSVFLGKVNIGDAAVYPDRVYPYDRAIYTKPLMEPKPRHKSFYLDESEEHIAGRKFYFHHSPDYEPLTDDRLRYSNNQLLNRYILPLDRETGFHFRVDFTNLEKDEFGMLLYALILEKDMRHKIGYAKPLGLGSIELVPTRMKLVDFGARYVPGHRGGSMQTFEGDDLWNAIYSHVDQFKEHQLVKEALDDLQRIWKWPPDPNADYYYPSKRDWFDTPASRGKRIADTWDVPPQR